VEGYHWEEVGGEGQDPPKSFPWMAP